MKIMKVALLSAVCLIASSVKTRAEIGLSMLAPLLCAGNYAVAQSTGTCTPNGSCSAATPACGQTTTGTDNCGNTCSKTGPVCKVATSINASATPTTVNRSQTSTIAALVRDQFGSAFSGASVSFAINSGPGAVSPSSGVSNASGQAVTTFSAPSNFAGKSVQTAVRSCISGGACADVTITTTK